MKKLTTILFIFFSFSAVAQLITDQEYERFSAAESALRVFTETFDDDSLSFEKRVENIHSFIPRLVAILKEENSFYFPFDSLQTVHIVTAPDDAFRIFTWQLKEPLGTHKYYGALQKNTESLELIPLFDYSDTMEVHPQMILSTQNWYGGLYYNCLLNEVGGNKIYTLFGFDEADFVSSRKFLEVLTFDSDGEPVFGETDYFNYTDSMGVHIKTTTRPFIEYSDKSKIGLNYDEEQAIIVYDHTIPPSDAQDGATFTYIPDGTYEGFEWKNDKWQWVEKIFHYSIGHPDNPPGPKPLFGDKKTNPVFGD